MKKRKRKVWKRFLLFFLLVITIIMGRYVYLIKKQADEVNKWESVVEEAVERHHIPEYKEIVMAIIFTETKGNHIDIMQSSESKYGAMDQITTSEESIDSGVLHLSENVEVAKQAKVDMWSAVQAYNFGSNYISFIKEKGGVNTIEEAEIYSRDILSPMLGNTTQETYRYRHPRAIIYNGGYLYKNGGNFFYAEIVKWNLDLLKLVQKAENAFDKF